MSAQAGLDGLVWPERRQLEACEAATGVGGGAVAPETLDDFAGASGVEADPVEIGWGELEGALPRLGPAVLQLPAGHGLVVVLHGRGRRVELLAPDGRRRRLPAPVVVRALRREVERTLRALPPAMHQRARWTTPRRWCALRCPAPGCSRDWRSWR